MFVCCWEDPGMGENRRSGRQGSRTKKSSRGQSQGLPVTAEKVVLGHRCGRWQAWQGEPARVRAPIAALCSARSSAKTGREQRGGPEDGE